MTQTGRSRANSPLQRAAQVLARGLVRLRQSVPAPCPLCGMRARGADLCRPCKADLTPDYANGSRCMRCALWLETGQACADCAQRLPVFDYAIVAFDYAAPADALVLQLKQSLHWARAGMLGSLLADAVLKDTRSLPPGIVLVPVPSSPSALRRRGFNPAAEIARAAGARLGLPVRCDILVPDGPMGSRQSTLSRSARLGRATGRFRVQRPVAGMVLAVVDDVMTTGSTLNAAAAALRDAGAAAVVALAVARTPHAPRRSAKVSV